MGCDIHLYIEIKIDGQWYTYNHPHINRYYDLFAIMAGVRNYKEVQPIVEPRGIPDDVSLVCGLDYKHWYEDAHSASYLTCEEMGILHEWYNKNAPDNTYPNHWKYYNTFGFLFGNSIEHLHKYPQDYPDFVQDVRVVFWFDN